MVVFVDVSAIVGLIALCECDTKVRETVLFVRLAEDTDSGLVTCTATPGMVAFILIDELVGLVSFTKVVEII